MRHLLIRFFGRGIKRQRMIGLIGLTKRNPGIGAIDRRRRCHERMRRRGMADKLQKIEGSGQSGSGISTRIFKTIAHARLCREMIDHIEAIAIDFLQRSEILEPCLVAPETPPFLQDLVAAQLEVAIVIRRKPIDPYNIMTLIEKPSRHMKAYEAGAARDKNTHCLNDHREGV